MDLILYIISLLSNDNLSVFENFIVWINFFGASAAVYFNHKASTLGIPRLRKTHFLVMGFAATYALGYLFLLLFDPAFLIWSSWFRGVSIVVWPIVWVMPAYLSVTIWRDLHKNLEEDLKDMTDNSDE